MARGCRTVNMVALGLMDQLVRPLAGLQAPTTMVFQDPIFRADGEIELFVAQFRDVEAENKWIERGTLLQHRGYLEEPTRTH